MLFNQDMIAYRLKPEKTYGEFEYYRNGGADEIIFVFKGGGTHSEEIRLENSVYRAEDYNSSIPRGITYRLVPDRRLQEKIISSSGIQWADPDSAALSESRRPDSNGFALFGARFSRPFRDPHHRQGRRRGSPG